MNTHQRPSGAFMSCRFMPPSSSPPVRVRDLPGQHYAVRQTRSLWAMDRLHSDDGGHRRGLGDGDRAGRRDGPGLLTPVVAAPVGLIMEHDSLDYFRIPPELCRPRVGEHGTCREIATNSAEAIRPTLDLGKASELRRAVGGRRRPL